MPLLSRFGGTEEEQGVNPPPVGCPTVRGHVWFPLQTDRRVHSFRVLHVHAPHRFRNCPKNKMPGVVVPSVLYSARLENIHVLRNPLQVMWSDVASHADQVEVRIGRPKRFRPQKRGSTQRSCCSHAKRSCRCTYSTVMSFIPLLSKLRRRK